MFAPAIWLSERWVESVVRNPEDAPGAERLAAALATHPYLTVLALLAAIAILSGAAMLVIYGVAKRLADHLTGGGR